MYPQIFCSYSYSLLNKSMFAGNFNKTNDSTIAISMISKYVSQPVNFDFSINIKSHFLFKNVWSTV